LPSAPTAVLDSSALATAPVTATQSRPDTTDAVPKEDALSIEERLLKMEEAFDVRMVAKLREFGDHVVMPLILESSNATWASLRETALESSRTLAALVEPLRRDVSDLVAVVAPLRRDVDDLAAKTGDLTSEHGSLHTSLRALEKKVALFRQDLGELFSMMHDTRGCVQALARYDGTPGASDVTRLWCPSCARLVTHCTRICWECDAPIEDRTLPPPRSPARGAAAGGVISAPLQDEARHVAAAPTPCATTLARLRRPLSEQYARFDTVEVSSSEGDDFDLASGFSVADGFG